MEYKEITIRLPYDVAHKLEVKAAMDDMRLPEAIAMLLTVIVGGEDDDGN